MQTSCLLVLLPPAALAIFTAIHFSARICNETGKLADLAQSKIILDSEEISGYLKMSLY